MNAGFVCFWHIDNINSCKPDNNFSLKSQEFKHDILWNSVWYLELRIPRSGLVGAYLTKVNPYGCNNVGIHMFLLTKTGWTRVLNNHRHGFEIGQAGYGTHSLINWQEIRSKRNESRSLTFSVHISNGSTKGKSAQCFLATKMIDGKEPMHLPVQYFKTLKPTDLLNLSFLSPPQYGTAPPLKELKTKASQTDHNEDENISEDVKDIIRVLRQKKFQYVILRTPTKEFSAHKPLLCASSPVFNALFHRTIMGNNCNIVEIDDIEGDTLALMMQFLHLEQLPDLNWNSIVKLYHAADKYQIELLKAKCVSLMKIKVSPETICEFFILTDSHQDKTLKDVSQEYFNKNSKVILRLPEWKDLLMNNVDLASDILLKFTDKL